MYFDRMSNNKGCRVGILVVSRQESHIPISTKLDFGVTNYVAEYEACIIGLQVVQALQIKALNVYGDLSLIIN